jgi:hypothetical protein
MEAIETIAYNGGIIKIVYDDMPQDPRKEDHLGTMFCAHRRYKLGDKELYGHPSTVTTKKVVSLPLYLYDHSGLAMSTESFIGRAHHAEWDSGLVGVIIATKTQIRGWFGKKRVTKKLTERVHRIFRAEVEEYSKYLNGECYGYITEKNGRVESCYGFYSVEDAIEAAKETL